MKNPAFYLLPLGRKNHGEKWYPGDTIAASVGQGYMQATPLQMARAMAIIANGGTPVKPYIIKSNAPPPPPAIALNPEYLQVIQDALAQVTKPRHRIPRG